MQNQHSAPADLKTTSRIMRALANENRLALFREIAAQTHWSAQLECKVCEVAACLKIGAPTISHHVKELEHVGLIVTQRQGKLLTARVNPDTLVLVQQFFATASP